MIVLTAKVASRQNQVFNFKKIASRRFFCYTIFMSWSRRRQFIYIGSIILVFLLVVVLPTIIHFYKAPTCFDGKMNQTEQGIDCGGPCTLLCPAQYAPLNVLWSRFSKVSDGVYNVLAYVENPNLNAGANNLTYVFKLYDKQGLLLKERSGITFAPPNKIMAVFEADLLTGNQVPARVEFSFTSRALWLKQNSAETGLAVSQAVVSREASAPRLTFILTNKNTQPVNKIEAVGIIYDTDGNTLAFSRTIVEGLFSREAREVSLNWPKPFGKPAARTEIVLKVLR